MAAAHTKQLEERLDRYERILRGCPRCTAALALEESEDPTPPPPLPVAPRPAGSSLQKTPRISSTASALSSEKPMPTTRQGQSTRSSKQTASTSRSIPPASGVDVVDPASSVSASASGSGKKANPSQDTVRASSRLSKQTTVDAVPSLPGSLSKTQAFTAYPLNPRPTTLKPSTSGVDTQSARTSRPNTGGPSLSRSDSDSRRSRKDPQKQAAWKTAADKMLGEVPLGWVWHARIFGEGKSMLAAVTIDADAVPDDIIGSADVTHNQGRLLRLVRGFAHRHSDKRVNFQHFLLACLCRVLSAQEVPRNSIVETLQICISDSSEGNVNKYLQGARWANELMSRLFFTDWRYRAIDLIVLWNRSIAMYGTIASSSNPTSDYFVSHLTRSEYLNDVEEIPGRIQSTIPWIVKRELGDEVSYATICKALGYSDEYISETKHLHSSSQPRADSDIQPSEDRGSTSESGTFHSAKESADSASSLPLGPPGLLPPGDIDGPAYSRARSLLGKHALPRNDHNDSARRDQAVNQTADPQRPRRMVPDRSAQPLGDSIRSAPATKKSKRPLADSPTSQLQSEEAARSRQLEREISNREDIVSPSLPGKKDSHKRRDRT